MKACMSFLGLSYLLKGKLDFMCSQFYNSENAYAMYCVRKLLNPICTYMHSLSILFSIYIDDIRIMNENYEVCITPNFVSKSERVQDGIMRIVERGVVPLCPT